jgi:hypothetical protein
MNTLSEFFDPNRFEVGDLVCTCTGHAGVIISHSDIIDNLGYGPRRRYYRVRILDTDGPNGERAWLGPSYESQGGEYMTKLPSIEEILGEGYLE